ncbi:GDSL-type esterase/lipase family protein [Paenibacillus glacialis]|uniref:Lysophospholipase n=1 Tax=Paenibacillus glacialis TaxID=494026 RepID=A0A162K5M3_9BACL|nr:GDSL-type esterase/lipase family protein [Paenibacillus glacialis]OAB43366.1 lysophospholipase [Paenibacillus glacialis]
MTFKYTAVGDSLTVGFGALPGNGFVPVYRRLAENHLRTFVAYDNLGVNGLTSQGLYDYLSSNYSFRQFVSQADIISISIGGNDLIRAAKSSAGKLSGRDFNEALSNCKTNFSRIIKTIYQLKKNSKRPYIIRVVGLYNPFPQIEEASYYVQQYNQYLESYVNSTLAVANIYVSFRGRERALLSLDHVHPNGHGYRIIAEQLNRLGYGSLI